MEKKILKKPAIKNKSCQINESVSIVLENNQIIKNIIVIFENIDKKVNVAKGDPP